MNITFQNQNPWRNPDFSFPKDKYIYRQILEKIINHLDKQEITVIVGSRQVGKTFLMKKTIEHLLLKGDMDPKQIFYFNFDSLELIELIQNEKDFLDFVRDYSIKDKRCYIFLDEAQRITNCGLLIKRYFDLGLNIKFIVSGSSSLEVKSEVKETLAGRKRLFELFPITFGEFLAYKGISNTTSIENKLRFEYNHYIDLLNEFILFGGYPGVVKLANAEDKILLLKEIFQSYIQKDIGDFLNVSDVLGFNKLLQMLATQSAQLLKSNELSKLIGVSRYNIEKYLFFLQQTYIVHLLRPYFINIGKALIKTPKLYFIDTGIRNVVFNQFQDLNIRADNGQLAENFVFSELAKSVDLNNLWFYRTTSGTEIDFLYNIGTSVIPIEVKYSESKQRSIPRAFSTVFQKLDIKKALVLTKNYLNRREQSNISVIFQPIFDIPFEEILEK
ncbi:hypothetical protein B6I21_01370 [candidate division KSB1 bacterium 4572_119]|nr:MAG: hypothetical protein B6I21_01370 [candidate division KSB1 bacterium 4572_119]